MNQGIHSEARDDVSKCRCDTICFSILNSDYPRLYNKQLVPKVCSLLLRRHQIGGWFFYPK